MAKIPKGKVPTVDEDFVLKFGKHRWKTIGYVLENDPSYIIWLDENISGFKIEKYIIQEAEENSDGIDYPDLEF